MHFIVLMSQKRLYKTLNYFSLAFFPFVLILVGYLLISSFLQLLKKNKKQKKQQQTKKKTLEHTVQNDTGSNLWISRLH